MITLPQLAERWASIPNTILTNLRKFRQIYAVSMGVVLYSHNEDIMHSFQKFIVVSFSTTLQYGNKDMQISITGTITPGKIPMFG